MRCRPHPLQVQGTHVQQFSGLCRIEQAVFRFASPPSFAPADISYLTICFSIVGIRNFQSLSTRLRLFYCFCGKFNPMERRLTTRDSRKILHERLRNPDNQAQRLLLQTADAFQPVPLPLRSKFKIVLYMMVSIMRKRPSRNRWHKRMPSWKVAIYN